MEQTEKKKFLPNLLNKSKLFFDKIQMSLISIGIGLIIGFILMLVLRPGESFLGLGIIIAGGFNDGMSGFAKELHKAAPIILTGLSFAFAYKAGLFNIGTPGQMAIGAFITVLIGVKVNIPAPWHWMLSLTLGMAGGALWGSISGFLKARLNVNEVVSSIMLNYIAMYGISLGVERLVPDPVHMTQSERILPSAVLPTLGLDKLFNSNYITIAFIIAILMAILGHYIINRTVKGYELKAAGFSVDASDYAGMKTKKNLFLAMLIAGAFAGLAGAILYSERNVVLYTNPRLMSQGFDGISVALLGMGEPIGVIFAGLFLAHLREGAFFIDITSFNEEIASIIISIIIYSISLSSGIFIVLKKLKEKRISKKRIIEEKGEV